MYQRFKACLIQPSKIADYIKEPKKHTIIYTSILLFIYILPLVLLAVVANPYPSVVTELFTNALIEENLPKEIRSEIVSAFITYFTEKEAGSEKTLKDLSKELGYVDKKKFAKNPEMYRGVITQFYKGLRLLLTHQEHGIAMDDIISVLGHDEVIRRLKLEL